MRYGITLLGTLLLFTGGCIRQPAKYFILAGKSNATNEEAVGEAQLAIENALSNGCKPISIGGGTGAGVGLGRCSNPNFPENPLEEPPCLDRLEDAATYTVDVLVECPLSSPDLLITGIAVP